MTATVYTLTGAWIAANRYTAAAQITVLLSNPTSPFENAGDVVAFTKTTTDSDPLISPSQAHKLMPGERQELTLALGDRLWVAASGGARIGNLATLEV